MALIPHCGVVVCLGILACFPTVAYANLRYLRTVAFSAQRTRPVIASSTEETIGRYGVVVRPDANHFNAFTGVFTAPIGGVYALAFTFHQDRRHLTGPTDTTYIKLVKESPDGATKTDVVVPEGPPAPVDSPISVPGASVLLELDKGHKMYLTTADDVHAAFAQPIAFSGYLLTRL